MRAVEILAAAVAVAACGSTTERPAGVVERVDVTEAVPAVHVSPAPETKPDPEPEDTERRVDPEPPPPPPTEVEHLSPGGVLETCQLLAKFPFEPADVTADPGSMRWYRDDDFAAIAKLCAMDLYVPEDTEVDTAMGVCPKLHWSTPALELYAIDTAKLEKADFQRKRCGNYRYRRAEKLGKLKVPVYYKENESALMFFHFSRLLGNAGFVYPTTPRTVARKELMRWIKAAIGYLDQLGVTTTLDGWEVLSARHRKAKQDPDVVLGSLAKNPRGETSHKAFKYFSDRKTPISRPPQFRKQAYYKLVNSSKPIADQLVLDPAHPRAYRKAVQALAYAEDFTNLVIMDHLFNERDRLGNIHAKKYLHHVDDAGHLRWEKKADPGDTQVTVELTRLLLKDNDDGLHWKKFGKLTMTPLLGDLHHLDATMYARMQWLAGLMSDLTTNDAVRAYFVDSVRIQGKIYDVVRERFLALAAKFERALDAGDLQLDLDLAGAVAGAPPLAVEKKPKKKAKKKKRRSRD